MKIRKKNIIIFFYKSSLFYKSLLLFMHHLLLFINIRISKTRFEIRDVQRRVKRVKIENLKTIMFFWTYPSRCHIEKIPLFDEKSFFNKFIFNSLDVHQKSIDIWLINICESLFFDWTKYFELYMHIYIYMRSIAKPVRVVLKYWCLIIMINNVYAKDV